MITISYYIYMIYELIKNNITAYLKKMNHNILNHTIVL